MTGSAERKGLRRGCTYSINDILSHGEPFEEGAKNEATPRDLCCSSNTFSPRCGLQIEPSLGTYLLRNSMSRRCVFHDYAIVGRVPKSSTGGPEEYVISRWCWNSSDIFLRVQRRFLASWTKKTKREVRKVRRIVRFPCERSFPCPRPFMGLSVVVASHGLPKH